MSEDAFATSAAWRAGLLASALWLVRYAIETGSLGLQVPRWYRYFDQSAYLRSAVAFAHGSLAASEHWYPFLYPLLAAPFVRLVPADPFLIVNCALFGLTAVAFVRVMRLLGIPVFGSMIAFIGTTLTTWSLAKLWIEPWSTNLSVALLWWLFALAAECMDEQIEAPCAIDDRRLAMLGALAAALPFVRPADMIAGGTVLLFVGLSRLRQGRLRVRGIGWTAAGGLAVLLACIAIHLAIYGAQPSDYQRQTAALGFTFADLPWKVAVVMISPAPWFPDGRSLLEGLPLLLPGLAGLLAIAPTLPLASRRLLWLIALVAVPSLCMFLAYRDLQPPGLWFFGNAHYFKWFFPLLVAGCWFLVRALRNAAARRRGVVILVALVLATCIRPEPVPVGEDRPARMLLFRGDTAGLWHDGERTRAWSAAFLRPVRIDDAQGSLLNVSGFHQVPDVRGERAVAVSRLFAADGRRIDPGDAAPYRGPERPVARYAVRLSLRWPCWALGGWCDRR